METKRDVSPLELIGAENVKLLIGHGFEIVVVKIPNKSELPDKVFKQLSVRGKAEANSGKI